MVNSETSFLGIKKFQFEKREIPKNIEKEIIILKNLGLEEYEIEYLIYLKTKQEARKKWE